MEFELRAILLVVGVLILIIVGFDFYRRKPKYAGNDVAQDINAKNKILEPNIDFPMPEAFMEIKSVAAISDRQIQNQDQLVVNETYEPELQSQYVVPQILAITIKSREAEGFDADELNKALHGAQMLFGAGNIFYRYVDDLEANEVLFRAVKAIEPGHFMHENLINEYIPGITLILLPEQVTDFNLAFDKFVRAAKQIAFAINGELLDDKQQPLTLTTLANYRQQGPRVH